MPRFTSTDLAAALAALTLVAAPLAAALPLLANEKANRAKCVNNLQRIHQALLIYSNSNKGAYPRTLHNYATANTPVIGTPYETTPALLTQKPLVNANPFAADDDPNAALRPAANDVTAALFLLVRTQNLPTDVFVCPSSKQTPWNLGGAGALPVHRTNFGSVATLANHLSYSFANPYPTTTALGSGYKLNNALSPDFILLADLNPGGKEMLTLTPNSPAADFEKFGNSPNHARQGQHVLHANGRVIFETHPFVGVSRDNIYTFGPQHQKPAYSPHTPIDPTIGFYGSPYDANDSVLLPTAEGLGSSAQSFKPSSFVLLTAQQRAAATAELKGTYYNQLLTNPESRDRPQFPGGAAVTLLLNEKTLEVRRGSYLKAVWTLEWAEAADADSDFLLRLTAPDTTPQLVRLKKNVAGNMILSGPDLLKGLWNPKDNVRPPPARRQPGLSDPLLSRPPFNPDEKFKARLLGTYTFSPELKRQQTDGPFSSFRDLGLTAPWTLELTTDKATLTTGPVTLTFNSRFIQEGPNTQLVLASGNFSALLFEINGTSAPTLTARGLSGSWVKK